jgi:hypothetical protein
MNDCIFIIEKDDLILVVGLVIGIATCYGLDDQEGREFESRKGKKFSLLHIVQTGSGFHPTSYKMGTGPLSRG